MNTLITGANGFIGKKLTEKFINKDNKVVLLLRDSEDTTKIQEQYKENDNVKIIKCSMEEYKNIKSILKDDIDIAIHLAWDGNSGEKRANYNIQLNNIKNTLDLFTQLSFLGCKKIIGIGTVSENLVQDKTDNKMAQNMLYAAAKKTTNYFANILLKNTNTDFVWCQLANIYGAKNMTGNLMSYTINTLKSNQSPSYGKAENMLDFLYIDDCVEYLYRIAEKESTKSMYYIGSGDYRKLKEYLLAVGNIVNPDITLGIGQRDDDGLVYDARWYDTSELVADTKFSPRYSFEEGIHKLLEEEKNAKA